LPSGNTPDMKDNSDIHRRRSIRLRGYDYTQVGAYFITICTQNRECLFGQIVDGGMMLNEAGRVVVKCWHAMPDHFSNFELDEFVVMPNHFHAVFVLHRRGESCIRPISGDHKDRPYGTLPDTVGRVIQAFKSITTHEYIKGVKQYRWPSFPRKLWQRNYYEHIIRHEPELNHIREYIVENPLKWELDRENPLGVRLTLPLPNDEPWRV